MVLIANECNPAYVAGALSSLVIPHAVNFGNHQFAGFEQWFGPQEGIIDFGPDLCILNRSLPWHEGTSQADDISPEVTITVTNDLKEAFPGIHTTVVMPAGNYICENGQITLASASDCGRHTVLTIRADAPAKSNILLKVLLSRRSKV